MSDDPNLIEVIRVLVWLHAELSWKFNEHRHHVSGASTGWGADHAPLEVRTRQ